MAGNDHNHTSEEEEPGERRRSYGRRDILKTTGAALASLSVPATTAAAQSARRHHGVDPTDRDSVIGFLQRIEAASDEEARQLWLDLGEERAQAVTEAIDRYSQVERGPATLVAKDANGAVIERQVESATSTDSSQVSVQAASGADGSTRSLQVSSQSVAAQAQSYSYSDSALRTLGPINVYEMSATLSWVVPISTQAYPSSGSSSGQGLAPFWYDNGEITGTLSTAGNNAQTTREREYVHDNPATTSYYTGRMVLQGTPGGSGVTTEVNLDA